MKNELLKEFLNLFWLRPENGILLSVRAREILAFSENIKGNSIDVSCGDGTFSFVTNGGRFNEKADIFQSIKLPDEYRKGNFDSFDYFDNSYEMQIKSSPCFKYSFGVDWKENLLKKADKLNFYEKLLVHDNNLKLPFEDNYFDYVYSNSAYWVEKFEQHIRDLIDKTKKDGLIVLEIKVDRIKIFSSLNYLKNMGDRFHKIIDAGRLSTWNGLRSLDDLRLFFSTFSNEIVIEEIKPIYGGDLAYIWDIGMRPLFKPLSKMANSLTTELRAEIKKEWVDTFYDLFEYRINNYQADDSTAIEYLFVLRKK